MLRAQTINSLRCVTGSMDRREKYKLVAQQGPEGNTGARAAEPIQFKDIKIWVTEQGNLAAEGERGIWSISGASFQPVGDFLPDRYVPRTIASRNNRFSPLPINQTFFAINADKQIEDPFEDPLANQGTLLINEFPKYIFLTDLKVTSNLRGTGGGGFLLDIFKIMSYVLDRDIVAGFTGNGNTIDFLKAKGFRKATFSEWTKGDWSSTNVNGVFYTEGNYFDIPDDEVYQLAPTPVDLIEEYGPDAVQGVRERNGGPMDRQLEQDIENRFVSGTDYGVRVRKEYAEPFWGKGWSQFFRLPRRETEFSGDFSTVLNRRAPIISRLRDARRF